MSGQLIGPIGVLPAAAAASGTTLDPTFSNGAHTLSNGNLTATGTGANGISRTVFSTTSGKYYFEATCGPIGNFAIGFCGPGAANSTYISSSGDSFGIGFGGSTWQGGGAALTGTTTSPTMVSGRTYGFALDATAKKVWVKDITGAGNWNNDGSANPATGVNGCDYSATSVGSAGGGQIYAGVTAANSGDVAVFNFGATAYAGTAPSGFGNMT